MDEDFKFIDLHEKFFNGGYTFSDLRSWQKPFVEYLNNPSKNFIYVYSHVFGNVERSRMVLGKFGIGKL